VIEPLTKSEREETAAELRKLLRGHHEILTLAEWRGSTAYVRLFIVKHNRLINITSNAGVAMGERISHRPSQPYGFKRGGYGYGREFDVVYGLGRTLYPKGHKHTVKHCHSNDHSNGDKRAWHPDGGYKFNQRSI
jgi:hypothetical protein